MSDQPIPSLLIQGTDRDDLVASITSAVVARIEPLLARRQSPGLCGRESMAEHLSVSLGTLDGLVSDGVIPSVQIGSRRLFDPQRVVDALNANEKGGPDQ